MPNLATSSVHTASQEPESLVDTASQGLVPTDPFATFDEIGHVPSSRSASLVPEEHRSVISERSESTVRAPGDPAAGRPHLALSPLRSPRAASNLRLVKWRGQQLAHDPSAKMVNVTHILRKLGKKDKLADVRKKCVNRVERGVGRKFRGTYISYDDALMVVKDLGLKSSSLKPALGIM